ncbi:hypothetical protein MRX96_050599 [Rhipicephalus microplus]
MKEIKERSRSQSKHRRGSRGRAASFPRLPKRQEEKLPPMSGPVNEGTVRQCCPQQGETYVTEPQDRQPEADTIGPTCTQPVGQRSPAVTEGDAGEVDLPTPQAAASEVDGSTRTTGKASMGGDFKSPMDRQAEESGVQAPPVWPGIRNAPTLPSSNDCPEETLAGVEEPPAKTPQVQRSTLRPRPNIPPDKRGGNVEQVGQVQAMSSDFILGD